MDPNSAATSPATWIAVAASAVSTCGGIAVLFIGYLGQRDKGRITSLESKVADCQEKHEECEERHDKSEAAYESLRAEMMARDVKDKADLQKQISELKNALTHKKDRTDERPPL